MSISEKMRSHLEEFYRQRPIEFEKLLPVVGRGRSRNGRLEQRTWIAKTKQETQDKASSPAPKKITGKDGSVIWVTTNGSDPQRAAVVLWVMDRLGFADKKPRWAVEIMREFLMGVYRTGTGE